MVNWFFNFCDLGLWFPVRPPVRPVPGAQPFSQPAQVFQPLSSPWGSPSDAFETRCSLGWGQCHCFSVDGITLWTSTLSAGAFLTRTPQNGAGVARPPAPPCGRAALLTSPPPLPGVVQKSDGPRLTPNSGCAKLPPAMKRDVTGATLVADAEELARHFPGCEVPPAWVGQMRKPHRQMVTLQICLPSPVGFHQKNTQAFSP